MESLTSLGNPTVKKAVSLHQRKYRDETGLFLVEGEEPCRQALEHHWECTHLFIQNDHASSITHENAVHVTHDILEKIAKKTNPQKVIGVFQHRVFQTPQKDDVIVALEEIRDPGNLGTIIRTAHAVGVQNIILVGPCCDPFSPEVIRASRGSFSAVRIANMSVDDFVAWQSQSGMRMIGTDVVRSVDYREADYSQTILVMGNEQKGLSTILKDRCTSCVTIPMPGGTESLNVSVATALLLYQARGL